MPIPRMRLTMNISVIAWIVFVSHSCQSLDPSYLPISICTHSIRRCSSDIAVDVWQWSDKANVLVGHSSSAHQCRNFEKIRNWARKNTILDDRIFRTAKPPQDDLSWPHDIYSDGSRSQEEGLPHDLFGHHVGR